VPRLSILIPSLGDCSEFEDTLASVLQNRPDDCEILVAHAQPYDDPYHLTPEVCFLHVPGADSRVKLLNAGFEASRSAIVHVLAHGVEVEEYWAESALEAFDDDQIAAAAPIIVDRHAPSHVLCAGMAYTRWGRVYAIESKDLQSVDLARTPFVGPSLQAGFYRRSWWRRVRWDEAFGDCFADVHLQLTLAALGAKSVAVPTSIVRAEAFAGCPADRPYGLHEARQAERLYWKHATSSWSLAATCPRVALHAIEALLALPSHRALTGWIGRAVGLLSTGQQAERERIEQLRDRLQAQQQEAEAATTLPLSSHARRPSTTAPSRKRAA
jgi:hypothetical protein